MAVKASKDDPDAQTGSLQTAPAVPAADSESTSSQTGRLFSNVDPSELTHRPGTVFASATLVAGTTVGAGILALPYSTQVGTGNPSMVVHSRALFQAASLCSCMLPGNSASLDCYLMQSLTHAPFTAAFS